MPPYVQPITQPYGDISTFQSPHLDNTINMLYQEHKQEQAKRDAQLAAIDNDMNKEYAKARSQDMPELTNAWADYRKSRIATLFDKKLQRDPVAFQDAKRQEQLALGKVYQVGNGSIEYKEQLKGVQDWAKLHPEEIPDNYGTLMTAAMNMKSSDNPNFVVGKNPDGTPITKNLRDPLTYRELTPTYDFATKIDKFTGTPQPTSFENTPIGTKGLQVGRQEYKSTAQPIKIYEGIINTFGDGDAKKSRSAKKTAADLSKSISDEDYAAVEQQYLNRNPDDLRKQGETLHKFDTPKTPELRYAAYAAMRNGIAKTHTLGDYKPIKIDENEMDAQAAKQMRIARFSSSLRMDEDDHKATLKDNSQGEYVEKKMKQLEDNPNAQAYAVYDKNNNVIAKTVGKVVPLAPIDAKAFTFLDDGKQVSPDALVVRKDGDWETVIYRRTPIKKEYNSESGKLETTTGGDIIYKDGKPMQNSELTRKFTRQQAKEAIVGTMFSGKIEHMELGQPKAGAAPAAKAVNSQGGYSNVTETNKGTIGVKNGKWYDVKTGKPIQ